MFAPEIVVVVVGLEVEVEVEVVLLVELDDVEAAVAGTVPTVAVVVVGDCSLLPLLWTATAIKVMTSVSTAAAPTSSRNRFAVQRLCGGGGATSSGPAMIVTGAPGVP
ncbi:MAG: hypothetical protein ACXV5U_04235 [Ilumatobacteraceae bacterium]